MMFLSRGLSFCFYSFLSLALTFPLSSHAATQFQTDSYTVFTDGTDIYLEANPRLVLIGNEVHVPLFVTDGPDLRLVADGSGGYTVAAVDPLPTGLTPVADLDLLTGDFDGDGLQDLFITPNSVGSTSTSGTAIALFGSNNVPVQVESYTQIQGVHLTQAIVSITDVDGDGRDEIIVEGENGLQQVANYGSAGFSTDRTVKPGSLVGEMKTEFDVTYGGAASYKVPLNLPTGAAGLKPMVSLNYNSQFGNGVMGLGWQLASGLARIEECYKRNTNQVILCLNGEELVSVGPGYYRTEIDTGVLVQALNSTTYELQFENGTTKTLSRFLTSPNVYLETSHTQRGGAAYAVNWQVDATNREPLVDSITYQGNEIVFHYEARNDSRTGYWMGSPRNRTQRLQSVIARADGQVYRQYDIYYEYDNVSSLSKVKHIQECGTDSQCLEALSFEWSDSGARGVQVNNTVLSGRLKALLDKDNDGDREVTTYDYSGSPINHLPGKISGDGRNGIARIFDNFSGDAYAINADVLPYHEYETDHVQLADLNNDGRDEIVFGLHDPVYHELTSPASSGQRFIHYSNTRDASCATKLSFVDLNGDNLPEAVFSSAGNLGPDYDCYEGEGFIRVHWNRGNFQFDRTPLKYSGPVLSDYRFVDINGDGLVDIVRRNVERDRNPERLYAYMSLGNGRFSSTAIRLPDLNFYPVTLSLKTASYHFVDMNADGLNDILEVGSDNTWVVHFNNGHLGFGNTLSLGVNPEHCAPTKVGDIDGDGIDDLALAAQTVVCNGGSHRIWHGTASATYIQTFTDSNNNQHQVEYAKLTDADVYTRDPYNAGINFGDTRPYQQALTVVKSLTTPDNQVYYKYAGARMHNGEHGYLGFKSITSVLAKEDRNGLPKSLVTVSYLNQTFPLVGKLTTVKKKVYDGAASTVVNSISYEMGDDNYLVAMFGGLPVGAVNQSELADNVQHRGGGGEATGTDFSGQMNSYFDWQSLSLGNGIYKLVLAEKVVDHLQLSNDALTKTERTQSSWSVAASGLYARLMSTTNGTYDAAGNRLQEQQVDLSYEYTDSLGMADAFLVNTSTTTTRLYSGTTVSDSHVAAMEYDYYNNGQIQYQWLNRNDNSDNKSTRTHLQYDSYGNLTQTTVEALSADAARSEMARASIRQYTNQGKYLSFEENSLGHRTSYSNYSVHGLPGLMTDPKGLQTSTSYDALGRPQQVNDHLGNVHYIYRGFCSNNSTGCTNGAYTWEHSVPAGAAQTYTWWDRKGQLVKTASQSLLPGDWIVQAWEYDSYGRETRESVPAIQSLGAAVSFVSSSDRTFTEYQYDELNRVVRKQLPGVNRIVQKDYTNELSVLTTDPAGRVTGAISNALGQLTRKDQADSTDVRFTYNAQGLVVQQRYPQLDSSGNRQPGQYHQIVNGYDRYGNQTSLSDPNQGDWHYIYNAFGELIQQTDARNQSVYFSYDALGRMRTQRDSQTYSVWIYDVEETGLLDTVTQYNIGSLSSSQQAALTPETVASIVGVSTAWQQNTDYNDISHLPEWIQTRQANRIGNLLTSVTTMEYDNFGRMQYTQLPSLYQDQSSLSAPRLQYAYSDSGYLTRIADRDSATVYQEVGAIDAFGNITSQTLAGNVELYRGYSPTTGWASELQASNGSGLMIDQSYGNYNALGHIGSRDDATYYNGGVDVQAWTDTFAYNDTLGQQLTSASVQYSQNINGIALSEDWTHHYQYDALGNIRHNEVAVANSASLPHSHSSSVNTYSYNNLAQPHRLSSISGSLNRTYVYDANGNIESDGDKTFTYNAWNKIDSLTRGSNHTRFEYGPDRMRYLRVDQRANTTSETIYVGGGYERISTFDGDTPSNNSVQHRYHVHGIALLTQTEVANTETIHSLISDYQDSVLAIADISGAITQRFRYTPYGEQVEVSQGISGTQHFTTRGYTNHEHIEGMDIIHMGGRIYDPTVGRMFQADPVVQAPELVINYNRYTYVINNPMNLIDPTGYEFTGGDGEEDDFFGDPADDVTRADVTGETMGAHSFGFATDNNMYGSDGFVHNDQTELRWDAFNAHYFDDGTFLHSQGIDGLLNTSNPELLALAIGSVGQYHVDTGGIVPLSESGVTNVAHELYDLDKSTAAQFVRGAIGYLNGLIEITKHKARLNHADPKIRALSQMKENIISKILSDVGVLKTGQHIINAIIEHPYDAMGRQAINSSLILAAAHKTPMKGKAKVGVTFVAGLAANAYVGYGNALLAIDSGVTAPSDIIGSMAVGNIPKGK